MNKIAQQEIYNHYLRLGSHEALKTAGVSMEAIRKALAHGSKDIVPISRAMGERGGGIAGSTIGSTFGLAKGLELGQHMAAENPLVQALLAGTGATVGMGVGNLAGRKGGDLAGRLAAMLQQTKPVRGLGNILADPFAQVRGINKVY